MDRAVLPELVGRDKGQKRPSRLSYDQKSEARLVLDEKSEPRQNCIRNGISTQRIQLNISTIINYEYLI
ncbi:hypothetical protein AGR3A_Cc200067 [Agrobacterium tomkonis CFBP 6623]|uniref:Uncharacterized protein n=1 Tax=Agrobacterium tomkonis CFBP 6623 TaxID=1183432 RepID=A0A1S7PA71_9HYPH|nr:hypothetical protein AGR3A_Cc200067 [Agrobacterium tomkonis CFBP 6623]